MIVDTSGLLAALVADQRLHRECPGVLRAARRRMLSPFVLAEIDHLVLHSGGVEAEMQMLHELSSSTYFIAPVGSEAVGLAR